MTKKPAAKTAICKELNCFQGAQVKGYCRLHFLRLLAGKSEGDAVPTGKLELVSERRKDKRVLVMDDSNQPDDRAVEETLNLLSESDSDWSDVTGGELDTSFSAPPASASSKKHKAG